MGNCRFPSVSAVRSTGQDFSGVRTPNRSQLPPCIWFSFTPPLSVKPAFSHSVAPEESSTPGFDQLALGSQHSFTHLLRQAGVLDMFGETEQLQRPNTVPIHVYFVPPQTVAGRGGIGVMIV